MPALSEFRAAIFRVTTDGRDGESRLVFDVPRQDLAQALKLNLAIGKLLHISVSLAEEPHFIGPTEPGS